MVNHKTNNIPGSDASMASTSVSQSKGKRKRGKDSDGSFLSDIIEILNKRIESEKENIHLIASKISGTSDAKVGISNELMKLILTEKEVVIISMKLMDHLDYVHFF